MIDRKAEQSALTSVTSYLISHWILFFLAPLEICPWQIYTAMVILQDIKK